jgi:hypothetical protein
VIVAGLARRVRQASSAVTPERLVAPSVNEYLYLPAGGQQDPRQDAQHGAQGEQLKGTVHTHR